MKNNTNERARIITAERVQNASDKYIYDAAIENMRQEVVAQKETVIQQLIAEETGTSIINPLEIAVRCSLVPYEDGVEEVLWDGNVRIRFLPVGIVQDNGTAQLVQQFERVPAPVMGGIVEPTGEEEPCDPSEDGE
jgi:hypothetical protein